MNFSEKIICLRKSNNLTQEQLAEKLDVSRQSVSKWETDQAIPEVDKLISLSKTFNVTIDYLLKPSEIDEISIKTDILEKQQKEILMREEKRLVKNTIILKCVSIYLTTFAIVMLINRISWEVDILRNIFPGFTLHVICFLIATAISIRVCVKKEIK